MGSRGFIAGPYVWTFNGRTIGISEDGWRLNQTVSGDPIRGDNLGDSMQDYVYRGGDVTIEAVLQEWDAAMLGLGTDPAKTNSTCASIFWPWASFGFSGQIGRLASLVSAPLVGVPAPTTSAATTATSGYRNLTITGAVIAPGYNFSVLFAARLRNVPIRLQALPYTLADTGGETWFTLT